MWLLFTHFIYYYVLHNSLVLCRIELDGHFCSIGSKSPFFSVDAQGCSTCLRPTHSTWTKWRAKRSRFLLILTGCAASRSFTQIPKLLMATATDCSFGCTPWGCFSILTPSNTCSPQVSLTQSSAPHFPLQNQILHARASKTCCSYDVRR